MWIFVFESFYLLGILLCLPQSFVCSCFPHSKVWCCECMVQYKHCQVISNPTKKAKANSILHTYSLLPLSTLRQKQRLIWPLKSRHRMHIHLHLQQQAEAEQSRRFFIGNLDNPRGHFVLDMRGRIAVLALGG